MYKKGCPKCGDKISVFRQFSGKFYCNKCGKQLKSNINIIFISCAIAAHFFGAGLGMLAEKNYMSISFNDNLLLLKFLLFVPMFLLVYGLLGDVARTTKESRDESAQNDKG